MSVLRLLHTVRYLRPEQFVERLRRKIQTPRVPRIPPPAVRQVRGAWTPSIPRPRAIIDPRTFNFLNRQATLEFPAAWNDRTHEHLWLFNLHYFNDLISDDPEARRLAQDLIATWIIDNPPYAGAGWAPYTLSLRIVNWVKFVLAGGELSEPALASLADQTRILDQTVETHLLGNHLLANVKALVFAGLFFKGSEADRWLRRGLDWYEQQIPEQILADGGHFERSPMYHAIILEDLLDVRNAVAAYPDVLDPRQSAAVAAWTEPIQRMRTWLETMTHPDGEIALFNDSALGIAPNQSQLDTYATQLGFPDAPSPCPGITHLDASGYVRCTAGPATLFVDVGPVGPDYLPAHAHADTLSYELSLGHDRWIVDSGTGTYEPGPERNRQRGTPAHNTVVVDGLDSSEVWHIFRVARRAKPRNVHATRDKEGNLVVSAAHDGYMRLPGRVLHHRAWKLAHTGLTVTDTLTGRYETAEAHTHLHSEVQSVTQDHVESLSFRHGLTTVDLSHDHAAPRVEESTYHPQFGRNVPNRRIVSKLGAPTASQVWAWHIAAK